MSDSSAGTEPISTSADLGRELKRWARRGPDGPVKIAALARQLNVSQSTLYAYLAGTTLPPVEVLDDLLGTFGVPAAEQRRLAAARDALRRRREPSARHTPNELPADPAGFTGRGQELAALRTVLAGPFDGGVPVRIATVSGPAGVGKTALVVHWSHRVAGTFPDGCLYADLHGYSPVEPRRPADVLAAFLRSLGVEDAGIPDDEHERAARFRSIVSGRRLLVVLDNALDVDHVRPLLPGSATCFAVTTSRADLAGLQVEPGARQIELRPLPADEGMALLRAHIGERVGESEASSDAALLRLARHCGGLPLALRIVAAQAVRRERPLTELVAELAGQGTGLLDVGDPATAIGTVFSWSMRHLRDHAADFWLFGAHPARDIDSYAASALLGTDPRTARGRVDRLVRAHLVRRSSGGRFDMHDLVRTYARERAAEEMPAPERDAAVTRLVDYYTVAATRAMDVLHPSFTDREDRGERGPGEMALPPVATRAEARTWLDTEWQNLLAVLAFTAGQGWAGPAGDLAAVLRRRLDEGGRHDDALVVLGHALRSSRLAGDDAAEGAALCDLGVAHLRLGRHEDAMNLHRQSLAICRAGSDRNAEARALNNLGNLFERLGRYEEAIDHYEQALVIVHELDLRLGKATLLTNLGVVHTRLGDHEQAFRDCAEALAIFKEAGDSGGTARTLGNLGEVHRLAGRLDDAIGCYEEALHTAEAIGAHGIVTEVLNHLGTARLATNAPDLACSWHTDALARARATGDRYEQARALEGIGCVRHTTGATGHAVEAWQEALTLYRQMGLREAERVADLLSKA